MTKPSCLDEIPKFYREVYPQLEAFIKKRDVQEMVMRRIIELYDAKGKFDEYSLVWMNYTERIEELKSIGSITDAMLDEYRKKVKR